MQSHFLHLLLYSTLVALFFAVLSRRTAQARLRLAVLIWSGMVVGALAVALLMYPFPR
ncbi:MAG: hypothetical protein LAO51_18140 [Acidobacteriia bacterium]|nr:hypothetical protein [Terriglobia bacterium]